MTQPFGSLSVSGTFTPFRNCRDMESPNIHKFKTTQQKSSINIGFLCRSADVPCSTLKTACATKFQVVFRFSREKIQFNCSFLSKMLQINSLERVVAFQTAHDQSCLHASQTQKLSNEENRQQRFFVPH